MTPNKIDTVISYGNHESFPYRKKVYDNLINDVDNEDWTDWKPYPKNWQRGYLLECEASLAKYHAMLGDVEMAKSFIIWHLKK